MIHSIIPDITLRNVVQIWWYVRGIQPQDYKPYYLPHHANIKKLGDEAKRIISSLENGTLKFKA